MHVMPVSVVRAKGMHVVPVSVVRAKGMHVVPVSVVLFLLNKTCKLKFYTIIF